jgi:hypothetical protein
MFLTKTIIKTLLHFIDSSNEKHNSVPCFDKKIIEIKLFVHIKLIFLIIHITGLRLRISVSTFLLLIVVC